MRTLRITLVSAFAAALFFFAGTPAQLGFDGVSQIVSPSIAAAQDAPKPDIDVKIDVDRGDGGRVWYADPTMLLIGGGVLLLLIVLIAFASRGSGGTTVIREK